MPPTPIPTVPQEALEQGRFLISIQQPQANWGHRVTTPPTKKSSCQPWVLGTCVLFPLCSILEALQCPSGRKRDG